MQNRSSSKARTEVNLPSIFEFRNKHHRKSLEVTEIDPINEASRCIKFEQIIKEQRGYRSPQVSSTKNIPYKSFFPDISKQMHKVSSETYFKMPEKSFSPDNKEVSSPKDKSHKVSIDSFIHYIDSEITNKSLQETLSKEKKVLDEHRKQLRDVSGITKQKAEIARKRRWQNARIKPDDVYYSAKELRNIVQECRVNIKRSTCI